MVRRAERNFHGFQTALQSSRNCETAEVQSGGKAIAEQPLLSCFKYWPSAFYLVEHGRSCMCGMPERYQALLH